MSAIHRSTPAHILHRSTQSTTTTSPPSSPARKRPRTDPETTVKAEDVVLSSLSLKQHASLWYDDGDVILTAGRAPAQVAFKIFRIMLKLYSKPLHDIITSSPGRTYAEGTVYETGETAGNLEFVLNWIFQTDRSRSVRYQELLICAQCLALGSRYEIESLRAAGVKHLRDALPSSLTDYDEVARISHHSRYESGLYVDLKYNDRHRIYFAGALLARHYDIDDVVPVALLRCCTYTEQEIVREMDLVSASRLSDIVPECVSEGAQNWLLKMIGRYRLEVFDKDGSFLNTSTINVSQSCKTRTHCSNALLSLGRVEKNKLPLQSFEAWAKDRPPSASVCTECRQLWEPQYEELRKAFWESLPSRFGLLPWSELKDSDDGAGAGADDGDDGDDESAVTDADQTERDRIDEDSDEDDGDYEDDGDLRDDSGLEDDGELETDEDYDSSSSED